MSQGGQNMNPCLARGPGFVRREPRFCLPTAAPLIPNMTCRLPRAKVLRLSPRGGDARVAEWQTRTVQVRVSERTWRFNSSLAHKKHL